MSAASTVPKTYGATPEISEKAGSTVPNRPASSLLSRKAGIDSAVRKMATRARVTKISSPEPTLRVENRVSPKRRPLLDRDEEDSGASGDSGAASVVLTMGLPRCSQDGWGERAGRERQGRAAGLVKVPAARLRARAVCQPAVIASMEAWASFESSDESGAAPALSAATFWPSSETM